MITKRKKGREKEKEKVPMQVSFDLMGQQIFNIKLVIKVLVLVLMSDHDKDLFHPI